jgi:hypothetical protein
MVNFLQPVFVEKKVFMSLETRKLINAAFKGLVEEKRETIRMLKDMLSQDQYLAFAEILDLYLLHVRAELAHDCQKVVALATRALV